MSKFVDWRPLDWETRSPEVEEAISELLSHLKPKQYIEWRYEHWSMDGEWSLGKNLLNSGQMDGNVAGWGVFFPDTEKMLQMKALGYGRKTDAGGQVTSA